MPLLLSCDQFISSSQNRFIKPENIYTRGICHTLAFIKKKYVQTHTWIHLHGILKVRTWGCPALRLSVFCWIVVRHTSIFQEGEAPASEANWHRWELCQIWILQIYNLVLSRLPIPERRLWLLCIVHAVYAKPYCCAAVLFTGHYQGQNITLKLHIYSTKPELDSLENV